jgi:hypothetical protein
MRYVSYEAGAGSRVGVLDGERVLDAGFYGGMVAFMDPAAARASARATGESRSR